MRSTLLEVLPLALGGAISPVILLLQLATLASRSHRVGRSLIVLASNVLVVVVIIAVVAIGDHRMSSGATPDATMSAVGAWIRIVLAVLLAATALRLAVERREARRSGASAASDPPPTDDGADQPLRPLRYFVVGLGAMVSNATTIVLLIPAAHTVAIARLGVASSLVLYAIVTVIVLVPSYAPLLAFVAMGRRGPELMGRFGDWLREHNREIGIVVSIGFAIYLGWTGFSALG